MEVLEKPKTKKVWTCPVVCAGVQDVKLGCGAKLRITEDDLFRVKIGNFGTSRFAAQFQCPECGARTDFFGYPEPAVLLDYWEHQDYKTKSDLQGYQIERWKSQIWMTHEAYLRDFGYRIENGDLIPLV